LILRGIAIEFRMRMRLANGLGLRLRREHAAAGAFGRRQSARGCPRRGWLTPSSRISAVRLAFDWCTVLVGVFALRHHDMVVMPGVENGQRYLCSQPSDAM
jgi:hypothetical protein